ncbi:MAG: 16S rRNA (adenine(1518)-N(6)/adenine(1519)-N(6))-dimethyltransferase RsmA [Alphaproteobacteria bacterium]|nr:16S rRNA (adenine(1518)-N(6)/adenine(1519)-N(6))-dimethyltransferase RsmA [Alphaproteobacteria bacterium]
MSEQSVRDALERHGLWAKKSFGQHFLLDLNLTRKIARAAGDLAGRAVIEVGPGPGGLTRALLEAGADPLVLIERDPRFEPLLQELLASAPGRGRLIVADAVVADEAALLAEAGSSGPASIVSNLPYNVGTPLLVKWLKAPIAWRGPMTLMFQKEVADRIAAQPGTSAYGRLAVLAQAVCQAGLVAEIPARAFSPPPKVASAVVRLTTLPAPFADLAALEVVTAAAFGQRRKMLRSALKSLGGDHEALIASAGLDPQSRAETIPVAGFIALATLWRAAQRAA